MDNEKTVKKEKQPRQTGQDKDKKKHRETGGPGGLEPTRYGDWERKGRCIDF